MHTIAIINVMPVGMQRIDKIYLGGSLRKVRKMSLKREMNAVLKKKALIAEKNLRNYIQKKYGKIDLGFVSEGVSDSWLRRFYETNGIKRVRKKGH
jgi:hypothetical protein